MTAIDTITYIPQRAPFVLVDDLLRADNEMTETSFTVTSTHILVRDGALCEGGLVENMAQTAAAGIGYRSEKENKPVPIGYIGALKNLEVSELPKVGDTITTEIRQLHQILNASIVSGKVFLDSREIASCELKIFIQSES